jgi:hypothetical protein
LTSFEKINTVSMSYSLCWSEQREGGRHLARANPVGDQGPFRLDRVKGTPDVILQHPKLFSSL